MSMGRPSWWMGGTSCKRKNRESNALRGVIQMTPAARLQAAIEILDRILAGAPVEQALTNWGRGNRFAGAGDRYALRDLVFDALRCQRSFASLGGGLTGRGLVLGGVRARGLEEAALFTGIGHAPAPVTDEMCRVPVGDEALDVPDWLAAALRESLGAQYGAVMAAMRLRAPVYLRVNTARVTVAEVAVALAAEGIAAHSVSWVNTALEVTDNERKLQRTDVFLSGLFELQDASSQAVIASLDLGPGTRVLDYCAGGGGKTLAMAARGAQVDAHDIHAHRMTDLPRRAARAGAEVRIVQDPAISGPYDVILTDAPCSGSGSWRRDPAGKWSLTADRLADLVRVQAGILDRCRAWLRPGGVLAYATCSLLNAENEAQIEGFLIRHAGWHLLRAHKFSPLQGGDGFFVALLTQDPDNFPQL